MYYLCSFVRGPNRNKLNGYGDILSRVCRTAPTNHATSDWLANSRQNVLTLNSLS